MSSAINSVPREVLNRNSEATANVSQNLLNESFKTDTYPKNLKLADVVLGFLKKDTLDRTNHLPASLQFHTLNHDLSIDHLIAYGLFDTLKLIYS